MAAPDPAPGLARFIRQTPSGRMVDLDELGQVVPALTTAPRVTLILAENLARHCLTRGVDPYDAVAALLEGQGSQPFRPHRIVLQDASGIPALLDLAVLRDAAPDDQAAAITPLCRVDLVVDHSIVTHQTGKGAAAANLAQEFAANAERYAFLRWAEVAFPNLHIIPPGNGIIHQMNLERLAAGVVVEDGWLCPETLIGTDSHTPMINGVGVLAWGVGGIEASSVMLGNPIDLPAPAVIALEMTGQPRPGVMPMDIALTLAERLRAENVVERFIEVHGAGLVHLPVEDRATLANMTPEYGASALLFPLDAVVADYLDCTGRADAAARVRTYLDHAGLLSGARDPARRYERVIRVDLSAIEASVAGPDLPQRRRSIRAGNQDRAGDLAQGSIVLAAITSCTNTSNPRSMVAAGLVAQRAEALGLRIAPWIKTSFSPGSRQVADYLDGLGLLQPMERLGFAVAGFGCMTCVGNSGDLAPEVEQRIRDDGLNVAAILSGNRNFAGRIHPMIRDVHLASPPLVVAYALAGRVDVDLAQISLSDDPAQPVTLADIWPSDGQIDEALARLARLDLPPDQGARGAWNRLPSGSGIRFDWPRGSTYMAPAAQPRTARTSQVMQDARALLLLGDDVTTDHISPVGRIDPASPAGRLLIAHGVAPQDFNSYASRRGNFKLMQLGTFSNPALPNRLAGKGPGNVTLHHFSGQILPIPEASDRYRAEDQDLIIIAGERYGAGSARDWAAKGTRALGVTAVIASSFERIHRTNLAHVGVLPLQWIGPPPTLTGAERFSIDLPREALRPQMVVALRIDGAPPVDLRCRLDTDTELALWHHGGFMNKALAHSAKRTALAG